MNLVIQSAFDNAWSEENQTLLLTASKMPNTSRDDIPSDDDLD
jgi:hypothetical protein